MKYQDHDKFISEKTKNTYEILCGIKDDVGEIYFVKMKYAMTGLIFAITMSMAELDGLIKDVSCQLPEHENMR